MSETLHSPPRLIAQFERAYHRGPTIRASLEIPMDRFSVTALVGPSGCGKTTILRCLAGLDCPQRGRMSCGGDVWYDAERRIHRLPQQRGIGLLFQEYALFPHLTAFENAAFGIGKRQASEITRQIAELFELLQLTGLENRYPLQLSGGQQQRVALARTMATRPKLLLLDEPLAALDTATRVQLRDDLQRLLAAWNIPTILVSHDPDEVRSLSHEVIRLDQGEIVERGPAREVVKKS